MKLRASIATLSIGSVLAAASCANDNGSPPTVDDDDAPSSSTDALTTGDLDSSSSGFEPVCIPGSERCDGEMAIETCLPTGLGWSSEPCSDNRMCVTLDSGGGEIAPACVGPCEAEELLPSSAGCSFIVNRQLHLNENSPDGLVVANPNNELVATIQIYKIPEGEYVEEPHLDPFTLAPGESETFEIDTTFLLGESSAFRSGGMFRVDSDVPVIAYHHAPLQLDVGNDSSMLLPEAAMRNDYVVFSYSPHAEQVSCVGGVEPCQELYLGRPTYFEIIALADDTTVEWTPRVQTAGDGIPIQPVLPFETGSQVMNRYDTMRITASQCPDEFEECPLFNDPVTDMQDVSGTVIHSDKPIWVVGASRCSRVPVYDLPERGRCDPLQEQLIPLDYWGAEYVAAAAPVREMEQEHWRIYGSGKGVRVTTDPPQANTPYTFDGRGDYIEITAENGVGFIVTSENGRVMPVQYLESRRTEGEPEGGTTMMGDPAMVQSVPVSQFLQRYVFATPLGYDLNYVQIIRGAGAANVMLDGEAVTTPYYTIGDYEVADVLLDNEKQSFLVESDDPFGIIQVGYNTEEPDMLN
jgi:hypothetical protein